MIINIVFIISILWGHSNMESYHRIENSTCRKFNNLPMENFQENPPDNICYVNAAEECQIECERRFACTQFNWYLREKECHLMVTEENSIQNYANSKCIKFGHLENIPPSNLPETFCNVIKADECQRECKKRSYCRQFNWYKLDKVCHLLVSKWEALQFEVEIGSGDGVSELEKEFGSGIGGRIRIAGSKESGSENEEQGIKGADFGVISKEFIGDIPANFLLLTMSDGTVCQESEHLGSTKSGEKQSDAGCNVNTEDECNMECKNRSRCEDFAWYEAARECYLIYYKEETKTIGSESGALMDTNKLTSHRENYESLDVSNHKEDCQKGQGETYKGNVSNTKEGITCQKWTDQKPNYHQQIVAERLMFGIGDHNYCRNPDSAKGVWCYGISGKRWEYCDVLFCT